MTRPASIKPRIVKVTDLQPHPILAEIRESILNISEPDYFLSLNPAMLSNLLKHEALVETVMTAAGLRVITGWEVVQIARRCKITEIKVAVSQYSPENLLHSIYIRYQTITHSIPWKHLSDFRVRLNERLISEGSPLLHGDTAVRKRNFLPTSSGYREVPAPSGSKRGRRPKSASAPLHSMTSSASPSPSLESALSPQGA